MLKKNPIQFFNVTKRYLNLQEYQSKTLMEKYNVSIQNFKIVENRAQAAQVVNELNFKEYVIKAQILAGGRGKGIFSNGFKGGVQILKDSNKIPGIVDKMINNRLITKQTPPEGVLVKKVLIGEAIDIKRETYLAFLMDRSSGGPMMIGSPAGGMDIEEVAEKTPNLIFKQEIDVREGLYRHNARIMAKNIGFSSTLLEQATTQIMNLYKMFIAVDATQIEINPLGETSDGKVICFDAKINFDDNAEYRQKKIFDMDDFSESDPREVEARKFHLNYIGMQGNIACLVNGAGLAMATMDIIQLYGGKPANFLDVGGNVTEDQVYQAFKIISKDPQVKAILVNIFGGIVNCAVIANGIKNACQTIDLKIPLIVRLEGTNVDEGKKILEKSGLNIITAKNLDEAAKKAVASI
ncbi:unnamed protein product [Gordionus sp. m RMFG-2023]